MLLDYHYFRNSYAMIATDLKNQQKHFSKSVLLTANLDQAGNTEMFFIIGGAKETFIFFRKNCESVLILFFTLV